MERHVYFPEYDYIQVIIQDGIKYINDAYNEEKWGKELIKKPIQ